MTQRRLLVTAALIGLSSSSCFSLWDPWLDSRQTKCSTPDTCASGDMSPPTTDDGGTDVALPLNGIWGFAANDIWAVGPVGAILHYDGSAWMRVPSPTANNLNAVWGASANDVWAVGDGGTILHRDGNQWTPSSFRGVTVPLRGISGSSASNVWAVGGAMIIRFDGTGWSVVNAGVTANCQFTLLTGVRPNGAGTFLVIGSSNSAGKVAEYAGPGVCAGATIGTPPLAALWEIQGSGWAVGESGTFVKQSGVMWGPPGSSSSVNDNLNGVWSDGQTIWAVGDNGRVLGWDGGQWLLPARKATTRLNGIWGSSGADVWVVGESGVIHNPHMQ